MIERCFFKGYIHDSSLLLKCILPLHWLSCAGCLSEGQGVQECGPKETSAYMPQIYSEGCRASLRFHFHGKLLVKLEHAYRQKWAEDR